MRLQCSGHACGICCQSDRGRVLNLVKDWVFRLTSSELGKGLVVQTDQF